MIDLGAARHCARIAASHYRHAGVELPERLQNHLRALDALTPDSADGSDSEASQAHSAHDDLIDAKQAAQILGCSTRWVRHIHADLNGQRMAGRWVFDRTTVEQYRDAKEHTTNG